MAQNIYDDEAFFAAYAQLPRSVGGLNGAAEWVSIQEMLPDMRGLRVIDLGCGYGWFCRWSAEAGAAQVHGVDLSAMMLERAVADTNDDRITYEQRDLDSLELDPGQYDLVYSSLTFHYLVDLDRLFRQVHASLSPGGAFVFSVEHPILLSPRHQAFVDGPAGHPVWPLDGYLIEGERITDWLAPGVVKQHRTVATYVNTLIGAGFRLDRLVEWGPSDEQIADVPEWATEVDRPFLLLASVSKE